MKIRNGWVSNSSSSSFVCEICGNAESGYDMGAGELGFLECVHGHIFCNAHKISVSDDKLRCDKRIMFANADNPRLLRDVPLYKNCDEWFKEQEFNVVERECPVCRLKRTDLNTTEIYVLDNFDISLDEIIKKIKIEHEILRLRLEE